MKREDLNVVTLMVSGAASLLQINDDTGELVDAVPLPLGIQRGRQFLPFVQTQEFRLDGQVVAYRKPETCRRMNYGEGFSDTGANPDFVVTSASRMQRELDRKVALLSKKAERFENALRLQEIRKAESEGQVFEEIEIEEPHPQDGADEKGAVNETV